MDSNDRRFGLQTLLLLVLLVALAGCDGPEERMARAMDRGQEFLEIRDYDKARVEFSNALQVDPNNNEAIFLTGRAAEGLQDYRTAVAAYRAVLDDDPLHVQAMAALARMMVFSGEGEMAMSTIEPGLAVEPEDPALLTVRAATHALLGNTPAAEADATRVVEIDPSYEDAIALLAGLYRVRGENDRAIELTETAVELRPTSSDLRVILAALYESGGDSQRAEDEMLSLIALNPDNIEHRNRLAQFYFGAGRSGDAEAILRENIEREPDVIEHKLTLVNFLQAQESWDAAEEQMQAFVGAAPDDATLRLALAQFYDASGYEDDAEAVFNAVIEIGGDEAPALAARNRLAARLLQEGETEHAETLIEEVIAANPRDTDALTMRGSLRLSRNELFDAITDFRTVLRDVPESPNALLGLARSHVRNNEPDLAVDAFRLLISANPRDHNSHIEAAQYMRERGLYDEAEQLMTDAIGETGGELPLLESLFQIRRAAGDVDAAAATAERITAAHPNSPVGPYLYGQTREFVGDFNEAEAQYARALELNPRGAEPMTALVRLLLRSERRDEARELLMQTAQRFPDNAVSRNLLAEILAANEDYAGALANLDEAIAAAPNWWVPHRTKAAVHKAQDDLPAARVAYAKGMDETGGTNAALGIEYAALLDELGDHEEAIAVYERLYEANPISDVIANNYAMMLVTHRDDEASFEKANEAVRSFRTTDVPAFLDTYGLVRLRLGGLDEALSYLRRAAEELPNNAAVRYHYGLALLENGQSEAAQREFAAAVETGAKITETEQAQVLLEQMGG